MARKKRPRSAKSKEWKKRLMYLLEHPELLPVISTGPHTRLHDDHGGKRVGILRVHTSDHPTRLGNTSVAIGDQFLCFREPTTGGGVSPYTHAALNILALAMDLDNKEDEQKKSEYEKSFTNIFG